MAWRLARRPRAAADTSSPAFGLLLHGSLLAMVEAVAHIHIKAPRLTEQGFVLERPLPITMGSVIAPGILLRFNNHAPEQVAVLLAFHQPAANQLRGNQLGRAAEEAVGQGWKGLGDGLGGYGKAIAGLSPVC